MRTAKSRRGRFTPQHKHIIYKAPRVGGALIDEQLPSYDYRDAYQVVVLAPANVVYQAVLDRDFLRIPLVRAFFAIRELPTRAWHRLTGADRSRRRRAPRSPTSRALGHSRSSPNARAASWYSARSVAPGNR